MGLEPESGSPGGRRRAAHHLTAREWLLLLVLSAVQFTHIVDFMIIMPLGPTYMREMGLHPDEFGHVVAAYTVSAGETVHPDFENPDVLVRFAGQDVDLLLGNKAELLLAMEQLTSEALRMAPEEHSRICFDANDRRILRIEELRMSAQAASERVKKSRQPFHFSPMNSRERRILHLVLKGEPGVRTSSEGAGEERQVVVFPADA